MTQHLQLPTFLYRVFDRQGQLLYVGITSNIGSRISQHSLTKEWWVEVDRVHVEMFESRQLARSAELAAIRSEQPIWNIEGVPEGRPQREGRRQDARARLVSEGWIAEGGGFGHVNHKCPCGSHRIAIPNGTLSAALVRRVHGHINECVSHQRIDQLVKS